MTINQISSFCQSHVIPKVVDNVLLSNPLFFTLYKKAKKWPGGTYFECPVWHTKNSNAEAYTAGETLTIAAIEEVTKAQYVAAQYNCAIALEGLDLAKNKGTAAVLNLVKEKTNQAELALKDLFGADVISDYTSATSHPLYGLGAICKTGTTSLGGISSGDVATWKSSSGLNGMSGGPDATTTALTKAILDTHYNSCKIDNDQPDLLITTDAVWSGIVSTFIMPNMRYTDGKMADLGFENFRYRQALAYTDSHAASGDLYFLNSRHLGFAVFPDMNFKFIPFDMAVNSDVRVAHIRWYGTLWCDSRRHQGWMSTIATFA